MPISQETFNKSLYDLLRTKGLDPVPVNTAGNKEPVPNTADVFKIDIDDENVWITIDDAQQLKVYYDDEVMKQTMEENTSFKSLLLHLKDWAKRRQLGFELVNRDHLASDMAQRDYMKKLDEGYYPMGRKSSYSDNVPKVKIVLLHTRQLEEGEQRFRNVEKIFVENTNGERFAIPTNRPGLARVYARHIAEGGTPYDERGKHITSLVEEYSKMAGFVRATKNGQFNESAQRLVNEGINHYQSLRETLTRMTTQRGYNKYFESYSPVLNEENEDSVSLNELFVQETLDPRIESVMPILKRLNKNINEMNEVKELEEWAQSVLEVEDETTKTLAEPAADMLDEAPGAETLAHNDKTEKSNLKAFDLDEEIKIKYEVVDKNGKRVGTWDGMIFKAYDRSKYPAGIMDKIPAGATIDKESGPLDDKHIAMGKAGLEEDNLDEINLGKTGKALAATAGLAAAGIGGEHMAKMPNLDQLQNQPGFAYELTQNLAKDPKYRESMQTYYDALNDPETSPMRKKLANQYNSDQYFRVWMDTIDQAKAKQPTIWNKIKNFVKSTFSESLQEGFTNSQEIADAMEKEFAAYYGNTKVTLDQVYDALDVYQNMMDNPEQMDVDEVAQILIDKLHSKGRMVPDVNEDLDANQKRVGQLGPTEKVGKNEKNLRGKLVGASESAESTEEAITEMDSPGPHDNPYAKGGKGTPIKADKAKKDFAKILQKNIDKSNKAKHDTDKKVAQHMKEGQDDLDAILRIVRK
jgi:hypothetical protein